MTSLMTRMLCEYHIRGNCRYGNKCWKNHNIEGAPPAVIKLEAIGFIFNSEGAFYGLHWHNLSDSTLSSNFQDLDSIVQRTINPQRDMKIEVSMTMRLISPKRRDNSSVIVMEKPANDLSVAMKTGNANSGEDNASNFHALYQKSMKNSTENDGSAWDSIITTAIDNNLLCSICMEIFIKPTVLNCSHTFCESCINVWTNSVVECPVCRVYVISKSYCLSLETFIENIVEHLPKDFKINREATIKERNMMKIEKRENRGLFDRRYRGGIAYIQQRATLPSQYQHVNLNADIIADELNMVRMNSYDTVVGTRGVNRPVSSFIDPDEQPSSSRSSRFDDV